MNWVCGVQRNQQGRPRSESGPAGGCFVLMEFLPPSFFFLLNTEPCVLPKAVPAVHRFVPLGCLLRALHEEAGSSAQISQVISVSAIV